MNVESGFVDVCVEVSVNFNGYCNQAENVVKAHTNVIS